MASTVKAPCDGCRFVTPPAKISFPGLPMQEEQSRRRKWRRDEQELSKQRPPVPLKRVPLFLPFCAARSEIETKEYLLCESVAGSECESRVCSDSLPGCQRCRTAWGPCSRVAVIGTSGDLTVTLGAPQTLEVFQLRVGQGSAANAEEEIRFRIQPQAGPSVAITDDDSLNGGLCQTNLVFGGPGSGKTYLVLHMLRQYFGLRPNGLITGGLILDPKGVLLKEVSDMLVAAGRRVDTSGYGEGGLFIVGPAQVASQVNLINVGGALDDRQLGHLLADIVISAFADIGDGWDSFLYVMMETAVPLLRMLDKDVTLKTLVEGIVRPTVGETMDGKPTIVPEFLIRAEKASAQVSQSESESKVAEFVDAYNRANLLIKTSEPRQIRYIMQLVQTALGACTTDNWSSLSSLGAPGPFERILHNGSVVLVSIGEGDPLVRRCVSTISKALFQIAVSARGDLADVGARERSVVLACDEYAQIITERDADGLSDSSFFSRSRQYKCFNLLALQSVHMGLSRVKNIHLWNAIVANANVRLFMSVNDAETANLGAVSAGKSTILSPVTSWTDADSGRSYSQGSSMVERSAVPEIVLLQGLQRGFGVAVGRLDGRKPGVAYFKVPEAPRKATPKFRGRK